MIAIYVIGTHHDLQVADGRQRPEDVARFRDCISAACTRLQVAAVAEEMSVEAVRQGRQPESVCRQVATTLGLPHIYCDPDSKTRETLGIRQEADLHMDVFYERLSPDELHKAIRAEHAKRERIWLDQIRRLDAWPVLFVCGAKHVVPFCALVKREGLSCETVAGGPERTEASSAP